MIHLLEGRESGADPEWLLPQAVASHLWTQLDLATNKEVERAHRYAVSSLDIDPQSGRYLLSGGSDGSVAIHDTWMPVATRQYTCPIVKKVRGNSSTSAHTGRVSALQWYPHDTGIFTSSSADRSLRVWDTNEMCVVEEFRFAKPLYCHSLAAARRHTLIAVAGGDTDVTLCDMQSGSHTHVLKRHRKAVFVVRWSPRNENIVASGSQDNQVFLWDVRKARGPLLSLDQHNGGEGSRSAYTSAHSGSVCGIQFTDDGLFLVTSGTDQRLRLWDFSTGRNSLINYGRIRHNFKLQTHPLLLTPSSLSLSPFLLAPCQSEVVIFELFSGKLVKKLAGGHYDAISCCAIKPNDFEVFTGAVDKSIVVWGSKLHSDEELRKSGRSLRSRAPQTAVYADTWSDDDD